jgi:hypothetical protein
MSDALQDVFAEPWATPASERKLASFLTSLRASLLERLEAAESRVRPPPHCACCSHATAQVSDVSYEATQLAAAVEAEVLRCDALADTQFIENVCPSRAASLARRLTLRKAVV